MATVKYTNVTFQFSCMQLFIIKLQSSICPHHVLHRLDGSSLIG